MSSLFFVSHQHAGRFCCDFQENSSFYFIFLRKYDSGFDDRHSPWTFKPNFWNVCVSFPCWLVGFGVMRWQETKNKHNMALCCTWVVYDKLLSLHLFLIINLLGFHSLSFVTIHVFCHWVLIQPPPILWLANGFQMISVLFINLCFIHCWLCVAFSFL